MPVKVDLINKKFGRLTVLKDTGKRNASKRIIYQCKCECGKIVETDRLNLTSGSTKSCGCLKIEKATKHGLHATKLYRIWADMLQRCENENCSNFNYYGARGIVVCSDWHDFEKFKDWSIANCYKIGLSIDREDVNGNYEPSNCRWVTRKEQDRNKRDTILVKVNGETMCLIGVSERYGISYSTLQHRYNRGIRGELLLIPKQQGINLNITRNV